ncbi:MAG: hypothetical protein JSS45_10685 [Proteobacteria bacterium]|nr:hypothetical protein [Pseudomonadota bacterium]
MAIAAETSFERLFKSQLRARDNFLSRQFGIFSEQIVACWADDPRAPYENLGRPSLREPGQRKAHTLDFTLRSRATGHAFVAEMKCEIAYEGFKYFELESPQQLAHHNKPAFDIFLRSCRDPSHFEVQVARKPIAIAGGILIWGRCSVAGRTAVSEAFGFGDVLSIEEIVADLVVWRNAAYVQLIEDHARWSREMFEGLLPNTA